MKKVSFLLLVFIGFMTISSCKKDDPKPTIPAATATTTTPNSSNPNNSGTKPASASLRLTLKDHLGNSIFGASVKLYASETDWKKGTNQVGATQFSDASGTVNFSDLSNIKYYWYAEKDCQNNANGAITTISALTANVINTSNVILSSTGTLKFVSTSSNPYRVYINGSVAFDMDGNTTQFKYNMPIGSYSIRVLQLSGYLFSATDKTFTGTLSCGKTLTVTYP